MTPEQALDAMGSLTAGAQVEQLLAHPLADEAFLAGDFNAQPTDPSMVLVRESARFIGVFDGPNTFPAHEPSRTIDFVLAPTNYTVLTHHTIRNAASDHCAVFTSFARIQQ